MRGFEKREVGNLSITIDHDAGAVYVGRTDITEEGVVTQELDDGFLVDRLASNRGVVVGVEILATRMKEESLKRDWFKWLR